MGDGAVAEQAFDVALRYGDKVADSHRHGGEDREYRTPFYAEQLHGECDIEDTKQDCETRRFTGMP